MPYPWTVGVRTGSLWELLTRDTTARRLPERYVTVRWITCVSMGTTTTMPPHGGYAQDPVIRCQASTPTILDPTIPVVYPPIPMIQQTQVFERIASVTGAAVIEVASRGVFISVLPKILKLETAPCGYGAECFLIILSLRDVRASCEPVQDPDLIAGWSLRKTA